MILSKPDAVVTRRIEMGYSSYAFSKKTGVSRTVLARAESGQPIKLSSAFAIARALDRSPADLFDVRL